MEDKQPVSKHFAFQVLAQHPKSMFVQLLFSIATHEEFRELTPSQKQAAFDFMAKMGEPQ